MIKLNSKMKILMRILLITVIMLFFILIKQVDANSINSIEMDIYIDKNGNAEVTEVWNANLTQGTEGYRPYDYIGHSRVSNFSVSDETGKQYETVTFWDSDKDFMTKAYKCGIKYTLKGRELCWGISNYGNRTYTLKYNLSNFVTQYTDTQGIYFNFLNFDQPIANAKVTIHTDFAFSLENARIWAFGNNGTIHFINGSIVLDSGGKLSDSQYMVGLLRFHSNLFNTKIKSLKSFDDIYESALNADNVLIDNFERNFMIKFFVECILGTIFAVWLMKLLFEKVPRFIRAKKNKSNVQYKPLNLGKKIRKSEIMIFRDIPCDGELYYAYWLMVKYKILKEDECKNGLIGAILLKWIKEGYIQISKTKKGLFSLRDNNYAITFNYIDTAAYEKLSDLEKRLMKMLNDASGTNNILEVKEFEEWCKQHFNMVKIWFDAVLDYQNTKLLQRRLITEDIKIRRFLWKSKTIISKHLNEKARNEVINLLGLKKFLLDYSLISERQNLEVHILEDYLIFAQLLGIADKVEEQFSKIYPDFNKISKISMENTSLYTKCLSETITTTVEREIFRKEVQRKRDERKRARARSNSYSSSSLSSDYDYSGNDRDSGGGGSSYSSGGGSAGGSSGGGFR